MGEPDVRKERKLVIVGDSPWSQVAYEYFTHDSIYEVVAFSVESSFLRQTELLGLPVVPFENLEQVYDPAEHWFYAALVFREKNRLRARLYEAAKTKGYRPASYRSSRAIVWPSVQIGEHCFICESTVLQPFTSIGDNVVVGPGSLLGHHSRLGNHVFLSGNVTVAGLVSVGEYAFLGLNSTVIDPVVVGHRAFVGAATLVLADVPDDQTVVGIWKKPRPTVERG
jgi:sugar O-acyltransferase (sialic acid O-acetyltransferase NeuD family)